MKVTQLINICWFRNRSPAVGAIAHFNTLFIHISITHTFKYIKSYPHPLICRVGIGRTRLCFVFVVTFCLDPP